MNRHVMSLIIGTAIILTALSSAVSAGTVEAQVLQYKLDHFYFNVGKESLVFPGHHFAIVRGKDTVVSGVIDESYDGVSIGSGAMPKEGKRNFEKYKAIVQTAETERLSTVRIASNDPELLPYDSASNSFVLDANPDPQRRFIFGNDTAFLSYIPDTLELLDQLERGLIDAAVVEGQSSAPLGFKAQYSYIPQVVMLLANPARAQSSLLSTSLYCRFETSRLHSALTDGSRPVNSVFPSLRWDARPFPHDQDLGRRIFSQIGTRPAVVTIGISSEQFRPVAMYFADVLAREQCKSSIQVDATGFNSDVALRQSYIDDQRPFVTANGIVGYLESGSAHSGAASAVVGLEKLRSLFDSAAVVTDTSTQQYYFRTANEILAKEFGCFPLFQPRYSLISRSEVVGVKLDKDGHLIITNPHRIQLPDSVAKEPK
jgi:hypothetical protein